MKEGAKPYSNIVEVIMRVEDEGEKGAKSVAYAWQLFLENDILEELQTLKKLNELSTEEWRFVEACIIAAAGRLFGAIVL